MMFWTFVGLVIMGLIGYVFGSYRQFHKMNHTLTFMMIGVLDYYESEPHLNKSSFLKYAERIVLSCACPTIKQWAMKRGPIDMRSTKVHMEAVYGKPEAPPS